MTKNIETIVIPSAGSAEEDLRRINKAVEFGKELTYKGIEVRYLISGIGPDLNRRLILEYDSPDCESLWARNEGYQKEVYGEKGLDVHPALWNKGIKIVKERYKEIKKWHPFGIDILSTDSEGNILNT
ncbi:MAG: hypothetical protein AABW50_00920, partial [Nanoarchaeota archaeon]